MKIREGKHSLTILVLSSILGVFLSATYSNVASSASLHEEKIAIGLPSWTGAQAIGNMLKVVLTEKIGVEATLVPATNAAIFQAMDQGKGDIDVHPDVWLPN